MSYIRTLLRSAVFGSVAVGLSFPAVAADQADVNAFQEAYKQFQTAEASKDCDGAVEYGEKAYDLGSKILPEGDERVAMLGFNYGQILNRCGNEDEAKKILKVVLRRYEDAFGQDSRELIDPLFEYARSSLGHAESRTARVMYRRAIKIAEEKNADRPDFIAGLYLEAGERILSVANTRDAKIYFEKAHEYYEKAFGTDNANTAYAAFWLGKYNMTARKRKTAEGYFRQAVATYDKLDLQSQHYALTARAFLVQIYEDMGRSEEATEHCLTIGRLKPLAPDQEYRPLYVKIPKYPLSAQQAGREGYVVVQFEVNETGFVENPRIKERDGSKAFERSSLEAVNGYRFAPQYEDGSPIEVKDVEYMITYSLEN